MSRAIIFIATYFLTSPAIAGDVFSHPEKLCYALTSEGLQTDGWRPSNAVPGEFTCMTRYINFGPEGTFGLPSNIAFYVNGKKIDRADDVRIKININNPIVRKEAFQRLRAATVSLLKSVGEQMPDQLEKALLTEKPVSLETTFAKVELVYEPGRIDSYKVVITDKAFIAQEKAAISASVADFERCKSATSKTVGYASSLLKGDGKPLQEEGYKSFFIQGQNKDMFFCEVHNGGKYIIRASLRGELPFKPIAEGNF
jgi:hypothetical protein